MSTEIFAAVVGITFRPASAKEAMDALGIGDRLLLEREPSNPYDSNAIRVIEPESGEFIGFIAKESNMEVAAHLDEDGPYRCEIVSFLATRKPHVSITLFAPDEADEFGDGEA